ncbi:MAG: bifunctional serine/threonine-protein kinase/formylglycine-generating enzyme family protein [Pseudomonadota bacterium]|nr:bifunctional serine/threonine-protein kinase/formylglycine-generating enzyme family protein [Pseudomonadota bacterium]
MDDETWFPAAGSAADATFGDGGRYRDLGLIARGGMGEVRRVWDEKLDIPVAMKILGWELLDVPAARARFRSEVAITARLQHPGIPAVYDHGALADGRPWFTITLVEGQTLADIFTGGDRTSETRRRFVSLIQRVADTVGYAHSRGVLHRDLKPANLMVGAFGEVRVMDWGVARAQAAPVSPMVAGEPAETAAGEPAEAAAGAPAPYTSAGGTVAGTVLGTPAYMAPEQARGAGDLDPTADVWSLGAVLYHALCGRPPYVGTAREVWHALVRGPPPPVFDDPDLPQDLQAICAQALCVTPSGRFSDAGALARALADWLDGAQRRAEALLLVERARARVPGIAELRAEVGALRAEADRLLQAVAPTEPVDALQPGWALEDRADATASEVTLREAGLHQELRAALDHAPDLPEAHALLADFYQGALAQAEADRDAHAIARNEILLATHDRGRHATFLRGDGALTLHTTAPARASLFRYAEVGRRLVPVFERELGETPLRAVAVPKGAWMVRLEGEGPPVRYPVRIDRGAHWDGVPPEGGEPHPIWIPAAGELTDEDVYVPAGWCVVGGDPFAADSLRRQEVWVDGFVMGRFPVTVGRYAAFLDALLAAGEEEAYAACAPRLIGGAAAFRRDGAHVTPVVDPLLPVSGFSHVAATRAAAWFGGRLPNELEIEKAARGVDGRLTPWGRQLEPRWSRVLGSSPSPPGFLPVGAIAEDEGPYGVRDLSGNTRVWCANWWSRLGPIRERRAADVPGTGTHRAVRGGFYGSPPNTQRAATRFGTLPHLPQDGHGLRLVRDLPVRSPTR